MLKGYISSNFHGAGKLPTTKMKSFMVTIMCGFFQTNSRQKYSYILILSFMYFVFIIISFTLSLSLVSY